MVTACLGQADTLGCCVAIQVPPSSQHQRQARASSHSGCPTCHGLWVWSQPPTRPRFPCCEFRPSREHACFLCPSLCSLLSLVVSVCSPRIYHSTSRNHCVGIGQDYGDQHGHHLQRHGQQDAAGNVVGAGRWGRNRKGGFYRK